MNKSIYSIIATFVLAASASAQVSVAQSGFFEDGNNGNAADTYTFSIGGVNSSNALVVGIYVDQSDSSVISATFGGVAPSATNTDGRLTSYIFTGLSAATNSNFFFDPNELNAGAGLIYYEVAGADLSAITTVTAANSITTDVADELVIGFAGRNGSGVPSPNASSILGSTVSATAITGGGNISGAEAIALSIGSQNISWNTATDGTIAYSFQAVPEPSAFALIGLMGLLLVRRR